MMQTLIKELHQYIEKLNEHQLHIVLGFVKELLNIDNRGFHD